jgi:HAE1 family hydrophobic/amphiphilic exporter-1
MDELRKTAENYLRNELIRLEGIAAVEIIGGEEKEVVIHTTPYLLKAYGLTLSIVAEQIQNSNRTLSGGSIEELGLKYVIRGMGEFKSLEDIGNVIIARRQKQNTDPGQAAEMVPVYLKDIADIYYQNKDPENIVRIDQKRCIALAIYKETKYNTVKSVENLIENLHDLQDALPGYEFKVVQNQAEFIETAIDEVEKTALYGILLAVIILFIFLRRIGTTTIISIAIPISVIATFNLMYFNGLTLNIMTLGGLALGAGMLVDNAIVVMENIFRNLEKGMSIKEASILGTAEVSGAITSSTITTIIVFLPIVYLHGAAGELFKDQAWTVAFSLLSSLAVAILVIPMLSQRFLKPVSTKTKPASVHFFWFRDILNRIINRRWLVLSSAIVLVVISVLLIPLVGSEFIPKADLNSFRMEIILEEGTTLTHTDRVARQIEDIIINTLDKDLRSLYTRVGPAPEGLSDQMGSFFEDENTASLQVFLNRERKRSTDQIIESLNNIFLEMSDMAVQFIKEESSLQSTLGTDQEPLIVEIRGDDLMVIQSFSELVKAQMDSINDIFNIETSFDEGRPEINIVIDRIRAGVRNINFASISAQLKDLLQGKEAGDWESEGEMRDITLNLPDITVQELSEIYVNNGQEDVRLDEIATFQQATAHKAINRRNQTRIGKVTAQIRGDKPLDHISATIDEKLKQIPLPEGYQYVITGEEEKRAEAFESLKFALLLSVILIYMVMASQFESLIHPFTILLTIPLAGVGAILIFFILGLPLNVMAYIGIIMLMGIAVNDSIILVDAINQLKRDGLNLREAILEAGQRRIRPIVMTSLTTILALFPLTLGFGESAALRAPMALAVIGGLFTSTLLTLAVIPCVYYVFDQMVTGRSK